MEISEVKAIKIDASCKWMSIEFGIAASGNNKDGESISAPGDTAYGRYIKYLIKRDTLGGAGEVEYRYLGIMPVKTAKYMIKLNEVLYNDKENTWRPNTSNEFRKFMTYARKTDAFTITKDDDTFPIMEKHFEKYKEIKQLERVIK